MVPQRRPHVWASRSAKGGAVGCYCVYYDEGGVLAVLLEGKRVAQFRLVSDAAGQVMVGDQPASFVPKVAILLKMGFSCCMPPEPRSAVYI